MEQNHPPLPTAHGETRPGEPIAWRIPNTDQQIHTSIRFMTACVMRCRWLDEAEEMRDAPKFHEGDSSDYDAYKKMCLDNAEAWSTWGRQGQGLTV